MNSFHWVYVNQFYVLIKYPDKHRCSQKGNIFGKDVIASA